MIPRTGNSHGFPISSQGVIPRNGKGDCDAGAARLDIFDFYLAAMFFNYFLYDRQTQPSAFRFRGYVGFEHSRFDLFGEASSIVTYAKLQPLWYDLRSYRNGGIRRPCERV